MSVRALIAISFFCMLIADFCYYLLAFLNLNLDTTVVIFGMRLCSLVCLIVINNRFKWENTFPKWFKVLFWLMIVWNAINIIRGVFSAETYFDWKYLFLNSGFALLVPFAVIAGAFYDECKFLFYLMITKLFVYSFLAIPISVPFDPVRELYPRGFVVTAPFFVLAIPFVKTKWKIVIAAAAITSALIALDFRTNVMRTAFAFALVIAYYFRKTYSLGVIKMAAFCLIIAPPLFLLLGITNVFNIFKPTDDIDKYEITYDTGVETNLATDTRTFLYEEVFASMKHNGTFFLGEGASGKYHTDYFEEETNNTGQRTGAEVGMLTMLLYTGIPGVLLHMTILFMAVYHGVSRSNSYFCKMLAMYIAFRWVIFFIEDYFEYDMNIYFLWLSMGLCLSKRFRMLTDRQIVELFDFKKPLFTFKRRRVLLES